MDLTVTSPAPPGTQAAAVIRLGAACAARGWVPATSGNFSVRVGRDGMAITASGTDKGALRAADILLAGVAGPPRPGASAETPIHQALYAADPAIGAVVHAHSPNATLLSRLAEGAGEVVLAGYELLKAIHPVKTHAVALRVPVYPNSQDVARIAAQAVADLGSPGTAPAFLIASHGLTAWGRDADEALRHAEALDFLFGIELQLRRTAP